MIKFRQRKIVDKAREDLETTQRQIYDALMQLEAMRGTLAILNEREARLSRMIGEHEQEKN